MKYPYHCGAPMVVHKNLGPMRNSLTHTANCKVCGCWYDCEKPTFGFPEGYVAPELEKKALPVPELEFDKGLKPSVVKATEEMRPKPVPKTERLRLRNVRHKRSLRKRRAK